MVKYVATRADDLIGTMGIATHINYTDGGYVNVAEDLKALKYLGVDHVRDDAPNPASDPLGQQHLGVAADAGVKFVFVVDRGVDPVTAVQRLHDFAAAHPNSISGIEGPNEVNNWPVSYHGLSGTAGAQAYQKALFDAVNADPLLKNIPVLGFTDYPTHASASDWNNTHPYPKGGDQPAETIIANKVAQLAVDPGKPFAITEVGYHTSLSADTAGGWEGVDETTQAKLLLNTYMDAAQQGSKGTFLYNLLDAYRDPTGADQEKHFGLFNLDFSPKPAATAIHNLISILDDTGSGSTSFQTDSIDYTLSGLPSGGQSFTTEKADGSHQITIWAEPDIWNEASDSAIAAPVKSATLSLSQTYDTVQIFDPMKGSAAIQTLHDVSSIQVDVQDHPVVVQLSGAKDAGGPVAPTPVPPTPVTPAPVDPTPVDPTPVDGTALNGTAGDDNLRGGAGNDVINGLDGNDRLDGSSGNDSLRGGGGRDFIVGGTGSDTMAGGAANDVYYADGGDKIVEAANEGFDFVRSSATYTLPANVERLGLIGTANINGTGNELSNLLDGNAGRNILHGGAGNDMLRDSLGSDVLYGDAGSDAFVFLTKPGSGNADTIADFSNAPGNDDSILLDNAVFTALGHAGRLAAGSFTANAAGVAMDANDHIVYETDTGKLFYDTDGNGPGAATLIATLTGHPHLDASDFTVI